MLVVVAIHAEQFPVAAIGWIEVVIVIAMMHRQFRQIRAREFACTSPANPRVHLQRPLAIIELAPFGCSPCLGDDAIELAVVDHGSCLGHRDRPCRKLYWKQRITPAESVL